MYFIVSARPLNATDLFLDNEGTIFSTTKQSTSKPCIHSARHYNAQHIVFYKSKSMGEAFHNHRYGFLKLCCALKRRTVMKCSVCGFSKKYIYLHIIKNMLPIVLIN